MERNTAIIVDGHVLFAEVIGSVLEHMKISVVGRAESADGALDLVRRLHPTIALVDLEMAASGIDGRQMGVLILEASPHTRVLAVTDSNDPAVDRELIDVGFGGFVLKDGSLSQFQRGIRAALDGDVLIPEPLVRDAARLDDVVPLLARQLTIREWEVLQLLVEGVPGRAIALRLGISSHTVRTHVQSILSKLQVHSRLEAAAYVVRHGLVEIPGGRSAAAGSSVSA